MTVGAILPTSQSIVKMQDPDACVCVCVHVYVYVYVHVCVHVYVCLHKTHMVHGHIGGKHVSILDV